MRAMLISTWTGPVSHTPRPLAPTNRVRLVSTCRYLTTLQGVHLFILFLQPFHKIHNLLETPSCHLLPFSSSKGCLLSPLSSPLDIERDYHPSKKLLHLRDWCQHLVFTKNPPSGWLKILNITVSLFNIFSLSSHFWKKFFIQHTWTDFLLQPNTNFKKLWKKLTIRQFVLFRVDNF